MSISDVLILDGRKKSARSPVHTIEGAESVLGMAGGVLAVIGWADWALLWVPLRFGVVEWEFGTISQSFDALPLATIGTAALVAAALSGGWRRTLTTVGVLAPVISLVLALAFVLFLLDVPVLIGGANADLRPVLLKAIAKTSLFAILYTLTYAWLGLSCWRALRHFPRHK